MVLRVSGDVRAPHQYSVLRRPVLLIGRGLAVVAIGAAVVLGIVPAIGNRATVALRPSSTESRFVASTVQAPTQVATPSSHSPGAGGSVGGYRRCAYQPAPALYMCWWQSA